MSKELKPCQLVELARNKRTQSIEKIADEVKQKITEQIMSAAENGYSYVIISGLGNDEARLIEVWLISEGFNTDVNQHGAYKNNVVVQW